MDNLSIFISEIETEIAIHQNETQKYSELWLSIYNYIKDQSKTEAKTTIKENIINITMDYLEKNNLISDFTELLGTNMYGDSWYDDGWVIGVETLNVLNYKK